MILCNRETLVLVHSIFECFELDDYKEKYECETLSDVTQIYNSCHECKVQAKHFLIAKTSYLSGEEEIVYTGNKFTGIISVKPMSPVYVFYSPSVEQANKNTLSDGIGDTNESMTFNSLAPT